MERVWVAAGPDRPHRAEDDGVQWADAIAWAALTGVGMALADLATRKGAEELYRTVVGSKPDVAIKPKASKKVSKAEPQLPGSDRTALLSDHGLQPHPQRPDRREPGRACVIEGVHRVPSRRSVASVRCARADRATARRPTARG